MALQLWAKTAVLGCGAVIAAGGLSSAFVPLPLQHYAGRNDCRGLVQQARGSPWRLQRRGLREPTTLWESGVSDDSLPPVPSEWKKEVLKELSQVIDPDLNADIVTLGFIKKLSLSGRSVSFDVELTTPACPIKDEFAAQCTSLVEALPWTSDVQVTMTAPPPSSQTQSDVSGMANVRAIVAVSSCKGGVGKSTTAVNLAYALQSLGASVGIFDADVYGPSLPTMIAPDNDVVRFIGRQIAPLQRDGVQLMSFGYVNEGSAVMRGPMVTQLLDQFLSLTYWGSLDYLILDMPPGTGDIQLTLSQRLNITAAVIVTTPQELSFADVVRGIEMFDSVNVPSVAVVENMAYYNVDDDETSRNADSSQEPLLLQSFVQQLQESGVQTASAEQSLEDVARKLVEIVQAPAQPKANGSKDDPRRRIFGKGHRYRLAEQFGIEHTYSVPLLERIAANGDSGTPYMLEHPNSEAAQVYTELAKAVVREVGKLSFSNRNRPLVRYNQDRHLVEVVQTSTTTPTVESATNGAVAPEHTKTSFLHPAALRRRCRCAACVEELTGRQILDPRSISDAVKPTQIEPCGNYAVSINWSDGHRSLYPFRQITAALMEEGLEEETTTTTTPLKVEEEAAV